MNSISVLDCTLRDGGYQNEWNFGYENQIKIIQNLMAAQIDIIECGLLTSGGYKEGTTKFTELDQIEFVLSQKCERTIYTCLMNYGEFDVDRLPENNGRTIDGIRVAFHKRDVKNVINICRRIKEKGYKLFMQPMVSLSYSDEEFLELMGIANDLKPYAFYIVDSFGMMKRKEITRLFYLVENNLDICIKLGLHLHNNLQLAFANAQAMVDIATNRDIIIDTSIMGMGRGAGNLNTELFIEYINDNFGGKYKVKPVLQVIDEVINFFYEQKYWGYSLPNYLSASHKAHPNYATYLSDKNTLTVKNMADIFFMMEPDKKVSYDKEYIEQLYLQYMDKGHINQSNLEQFKSLVSEKRVLLIAPGRSSEEEYKKVVEFARQKDVLTISVNFAYAHYNVDFLFVSNLRRYHEMEIPTEQKMIVTSNIGEEAYLTIDYKEFLNSYETISDNAAMMLIHFLISAGAKEINLAGLDGYSHDMNQNYAEPQLQLVTPHKILDLMNTEMNAMLQAYSKQCRITFITKSKYLHI